MTYTRPVSLTLKPYLDRHPTPIGCRRRYITPKTQDGNRWRFWHRRLPCEYTPSCEHTSGEGSCAARRRLPPSGRSTRRQRPQPVPRQKSVSEQVTQHPASSRRSLAENLSQKSLSERFAGFSAALASPHVITVFACSFRVQSPAAATDLTLVLHSPSSASAVGGHSSSTAFSKSDVEVFRTLLSVNVRTD